jgi:hypothetical protein
MKLEQTAYDTLNNKKEVLYNEEGDILGWLKSGPIIKLKRKIDTRNLFIPDKQDWNQ